MILNNYFFPFRDLETKVRFNFLDIIRDIH